MPRIGKEFKVFGMRRSGMHAVIYWLAKHYSEQVWFANDLKSFGNPKAPHEELPKTYEPDEYISPLDYPDFWDRDKNVLMYCCEDMDHSGLDWESNRNVVGDSESWHSVLLVRDPFNLFASRYRLGMVLTEESKEFWKMHAMEALGNTDHLRNKVVVNYSRWFSDASYRRDLERQMGLPMSDDGIERVYGLGSSFAGTSTNGRASQMKVNERWRSYLSDMDFIEFFDEEMVRLAWALFGGVPKPFMNMAL